MLSARARTAVRRSRFGLRGRGRRGARFLPGLDGPRGKRAPADRDPVPLPRSGHHAEHTKRKAFLGAEPTKVHVADGLSRRSQLTPAFAHSSLTIARSAAT